MSEFSRTEQQYQSLSGIIDQCFQFPNFHTLMWKVSFENSLKLFECFLGVFLHQMCCTLNTKIKYKIIAAFVDSEKVGFNINCVGYVTKQNKWTSGTFGENFQISNRYLLPNQKTTLCLLASQCVHSVTLRCPSRLVSLLLTRSLQMWDLYGTKPIQCFGCGLL